MSGLFKWYYLAQLAFWFQQILVIHIEKRRKDHIQMLTHHIITCTLISITYVYRCTRAANIVLCLMDVADLLLPVSVKRLLRQAILSSLPPNQTHMFASYTIQMLTEPSIYTDCQDSSLFTLRDRLQFDFLPSRHIMVHSTSCYISQALLRYMG